MLSNGAILARHMHLLNVKLEPFMNDPGSQRVVETQEWGLVLSHEERECL